MPIDVPVRVTEELPRDPAVRRPALAAPRASGTRASGTRASDPAAPATRVVELAVLERVGVDHLRATAIGERLVVGSHAAADLRLEDPTVSRFHCEVHRTARGFVIDDLASCNGTRVDGVAIERAWLDDGMVVRVGRCQLMFSRERHHEPVPCHPEPGFGELVGTSPASRELFALLAGAADGEQPLLLGGEPGAPRARVAAAVHRAGRRATQPFVVVRCASQLRGRLERTLFGGAAADGTADGATDGAADGALAPGVAGTVLLTDVDELPAELQLRLVRALDARGTPAGVRPRLIVTSDRDLRREVAAGRFRVDLYVRLAAFAITVPTTLT